MCVTYSKLVIATFYFNYVTMNEYSVNVCSFLKLKHVLLAAIIKFRVLWVRFRRLQPTRHNLLKKTQSQRKWFMTVVYMYPLMSVYTIFIYTVDMCGLCG